MSWIARIAAILLRCTLAELRSHTLTSVTAVTANPVPALQSLDGVVDLVAEPRPDGVHTSFRAGRGALGAAVGFVASSHPAVLTVEPPSLDELFRTNFRTDAAEAVPAGAR